MNSIDDLFKEDGSLVANYQALIERNSDLECVKAVKHTWGKKLTQKIYNYVNTVETKPTCPVCGRPLAFTSYEKGYAQFCGGTKCVHQKKNKDDSSFLPPTANIDTSDVTDGKPKILGQTKDFQTNEYTSSIITTLKDASAETLLKEHSFKPEDWILTKVRHSIWQQNSKANGLRDLYASQIHVKPRCDVGFAEEDIIDRLEKVSKYKPSAKNFFNLKPTPKKGGCVLLLPVCDLHYGLLASNTTTGNEYNTEIAQARFNQYIVDAVERAKATKLKIEEIIFTIGNDFYNADTLSGTTVKGTPQDQQDHLTNLAESATNFIMDTIEYLKKIAPVTVLAVKANHDWTASFYMMLAIYHKYKDDPQVTPILSRQTRVYLQYGQNLFGFAHDQKPQEAPKLMATEAALPWSKTKYRTFFLAHLHHEIVEEVSSVVVRRLPTLSGHSIWSNDQGFIGSTARGQAFIFSEDKGLLYILNIEVD